MPKPEVSAPPALACLALLALAFALAPAAAAAQVRASEPGSVSQTVDGTVIALEYSRPVARGRDSLFGGVVEWDLTWTPGANWATTLEVSRAVRINGEALPEGTYSVWMVPRADAPWQVIFHSDHRRFHTQRPEEGDEGEALRVEAEPGRGWHLETLTWYFPVVTRAGATLRMHWGDLFVPLRIAVQPSRTLALTASERRPYPGSYAMTVGSGEDASAHAVEVFEDGDRLRARIAPAIPGVDAAFDLIPASARPARDHRFNAGWYQDGALYDVDAEVALVFEVGEGRASGFELTGRGRVIGRAERTPPE